MIIISVIFVPLVVTQPPASGFCLFSFSFSIGQEAPIFFKRGNQLNFNLFTGGAMWAASLLSPVAVALTFAQAVELEYLLEGMTVCFLFSNKSPHPLILQDSFFNPFSFLFFFFLVEQC